MPEIIFKEESYQIIGACMKVHHVLGYGFLEAVYQESLEKEFQKQSIPYQRHPKLSLYYEGEKLKKYYIPDFICYQSIVLELKASKMLTTADFMQLQNSLNAAKQRLGLLVNFGTPSLTYKRILNPLS